jgi:hypothetical protein
LTGLLDPTAPWVWVLYTLAGAALVVVTEPVVLKMLGQLERDAYAAHPPLRAMMLLVMWLFWPLIAAVWVFTGIIVAADWAWENLVWVCQWIGYGAGVLLDRLRRS